MAAPLRVLVVDDSPWDAELLELELRRGGYEPIVRRVDTVDSLKRALGEGEWELVVSDYSLPGMTALDALSTHQAAGCAAPFLVVSGSADPKRAAQILAAGARAFVEKGDPSLLKVVEGLLGRA